MKNKLEDYKQAPISLDSFYRGIVEDNNDPALLGRVKIRLVGIHTDIKTASEINGIPTDHLPWATPIQPVNGGGTSGFGTFTIPIQGTQVFVFFENGNILQPRYFGVSPGQPSETSAEIQNANSNPQNNFTKKGKLEAPKTFPSNVAPVSDDVLNNTDLKVYLTRFEHDINKGTKGNVVVKSIPKDGGQEMTITKFVSLELPWLNNASSISCIPKGEYPCTYTRSNNAWIGQSYILSNVPKRYGIRIHKGWWAGTKQIYGYASDVEGCIIFGTDFIDAISSKGKYEQYKILNGEASQAKLDNLLDQREFTLIVDGVVG